MAYMYSFSVIEVTGWECEAGYGKRPEIYHYFNDEDDAIDFAERENESNTDPNYYWRYEITDHITEHELEKRLKHKDARLRFKFGERPYTPYSRRPKEKTEIERPSHGMLAVLAAAFTDQIVNLDPGSTEEFAKSVERGYTGTYEDWVNVRKAAKAAAMYIDLEKGLPE